jgi:hypothetical protein
MACRGHAVCYATQLADYLVLRMSTAIARIYTQEGFVVAADGRKLNGRSGQIASDEVQKIFPLHHPFGDISCSIAGVAQFTSELGLFDFGVEAGRAALAIAKREARSHYEYSELLASEISRSLEGFNPASLCSGTEQTTRLFLDGYFSGLPVRSKIELTYRTDRTDSLVSPEKLVPGETKVYGSSIISAMLFATMPHDHFRSYRQVCQKAKPTAMAEATRVALNVIRAHCCPEAMSIDPEMCTAVGGHIHIATVTQTGFKWALPPTRPATDVSSLSQHYRAHFGDV